MAPDGHPLGVVQRARLVEHGVGNAILPTSCSMPARARTRNRLVGRIFLCNSPLLMLFVPDEDGVAAGEQLLRSYFGMHRFEWPDDDSVEFHLGHGDMIRLLRRCGLEVEDLLELRPGPGAVASHPLATLEWARQWPCEEGWKARKVDRA